MLREGERIKIFEDTDVLAYVGMIEDEGFSCKVYSDRIVIGKRIRNQSTYNLSALGRLIKQNRLVKGWSQNRLAAEMNVRKETVMNWEDGLRQPRFEKIKKMQKLFNISKGELDKCRM